MKPATSSMPDHPLAVMPAVGGRSSSSTMFDQPLVREDSASLLAALPCVREDSRSVHGWQAGSAGEQLLVAHSVSTSC